MNREKRLAFQVYSAIFMLVSGVALSAAGFYVPPRGEISDSVLMFFAQCLIYAGSIFGVTVYIQGKYAEIMRIVKSQRTPPEGTGQQAPPQNSDTAQATPTAPDTHRPEANAYFAPDTEETAPHTNALLPPRLWSISFELLIQSHPPPPVCKHFPRLSYFGFSVGLRAFFLCFNKRGQKLVGTNFYP